MATTKTLLYKSNKRKDGTCPVCLRITKDNKIKYISLGLYATEEQWNSEGECYKRDKRLCPDYLKYNSLLTHYSERSQQVIRKFIENKEYWTLNQFEEEFLGAARHGKVYDFLQNRIQMLIDTKHRGSANLRTELRNILCRYDSKFKERLFCEIDIKYVERLNYLMEKDGLCRNTRRGYLRVLRSTFNEAIKAKEATSDKYPFGKEGFCIEALSEETAKRYLKTEELERLKSTPQDKRHLEIARKVFLFSYYCFGMSYIDMAYLSKDNIVSLNTGLYISYKRQKTKTRKNTKPIIIPITAQISELLDWFKENTKLVGNYLLPIVGKDKKDIELYDHIYDKFTTYSHRFKELGKALGFEIRLTSYVARHTMAMTLQRNLLPREIISQTMGHKDIKTTNTYLDSFDTSVLDGAAVLL